MSVNKSTMNGHLAFVDTSALRNIKNIESLIESSVKLQGASSQRNRFALLDLDCDGSLLVRQQHAGCKDKINQITGQKQQQGQPYDAQKSLATTLPTLYHITQGNGLSILLAAQESIGAPKLCNLQHGWKLHTKQLHRLGGDDETADCVTLLTKLPSNPEGVKTFLQFSADVRGADEQLPDPEAGEQAYITAVYHRCQQLLGEWLNFFRHRNVRILLLATGYDEMEASKAETLLAYSLHLLLLTESTAGSCVCPISLSESSHGDTWELDRSWPRNVLKQVLQAAGQTGRLDELRAKVQALKLAKDADGDKWVQQQYESFQWRTSKPSAAGAKPHDDAAAAAPRQAKPTASGAGSVGAAPAAAAAAAAGDGEARKRMRRTAAERAAAAGGDTGPPPRQPLKAAQQNQQQVQQPANSASVGCPAGSHAGGSRRSDSQPVGGIRAVVSHAARRLMAASDQPQQSKQHRKPGGAGLVAERALGLGTTRSRIWRDSAGLLQLGGSQEPNSSAFTGGSSRQQQKLGSQKELIPPITSAAVAAVDGTTDTAHPAAEGGVALEPAVAATQASDQEVHTTIEVKDSEHQPASQHNQQKHKPSSGGTGCLVAANLDGNAAADVATAAVKSELERLLAGRKRSGSLRSKHVATLKEDLTRLCEVAVKALVQQCPEDQQQWAYGISAAAKEAVLYAKQELGRMKDSTLKKLAHQLDGVGDPSPDATAAAKTAGLPTPDEAAVRRARLRQGLLVLTGRDHYLYKRIPGVHIPEVVLQPAFWTLFCLHSVLVVGPLVDPPTPTPDMQNDGVRWSAKIQYVSAERHIDWFLENVDGGWSLWATRIRKDQQQQQQQEAAAITVKPAAGGDLQEQQGSQEPLLLFGAYADAYEWFTAVVLPGLESQDWLVGLHLLLSRWSRGHRVEEGSMQVPRVVDFDTQHQLGDPTLLGAAMVEDIRRQQEQQRKELRRALRNYEKGEAQRKKQEAQGAGEGVGMTEGMHGSAVIAAAAAAGGAGRGDKKRCNDDEADCSGGSATKATKRRCPGIEATSKPAAAGRPSRVNSALMLRRKHAAAVNDPLKAMKNLKGLPGKNKLRLDEGRVPKKQQKQKPKHPRDLKEIEDDADSTQRKQKNKSAAAAAADGGGGGDSGPGSGGTTAANAGSGALVAAGSGGQQKAKEPNKFARQKVVKQQPVKEHQDDRNVEAVLADFGIDLGGSSMQLKPPAPAAFATAVAGAAAIPAAGAKRPGIFGIAGLVGGAPKLQALPRLADPFGFQAPRPAAAAPAATVAVVASAATAAAQPATGASSAAAVAVAVAAVAEVAAAVHVPEIPGEEVLSADDMRVEAGVSDHCPANAHAADVAVQQHESGCVAGQTPLHLEAFFAAAAVAPIAEVDTVHPACATDVNAGQLQAQQAAGPEQPDRKGGLQAQQPARHAEQCGSGQEQLVQQVASQEQQQGEQPLAASSKKRKAATFGLSGSKQKQYSAAELQQQIEHNALSPPGRCITRQKSAELQAHIAADWRQDSAPPSARTRHAGVRTPTAVVLSALYAVEGKKSSKQGRNRELQQQQQKQLEDTAVDKLAAVAAQQQDVLYPGMAVTATAEVVVVPVAPGVTPGVATAERQQQQCGNRQHLQPGAATAAGLTPSQQEQLQGEHALVAGLHAAVAAAAAAGAAADNEVVPAAKAVTPTSTGRRAARRTAAAVLEQEVQDAGMTPGIVAGAEVTLPAQSAGTTAAKRGRLTGRDGSKEQLQQQQGTLSSPPGMCMIQSAPAAAHAAEQHDAPPSAGTRHAGSRRPVLFGIQSQQQFAAPPSDAQFDAAAVACAAVAAAAVESAAAAVAVAGSAVVRRRVGGGRSRSKNSNKIEPERNAAAAAVKVPAAGAVDGSAAGNHDAGAEAAAMAAAADAGESVGAAAGTPHRGRSTSRQHYQPAAAGCNQAVAAAVAAGAAAPRRFRRAAGEEAAAESQLAQTPVAIKPKHSRTIHQQSQQQHEIQPSTADLDQQQPAAEVDTSVGTAGTGSRNQRQQRRRQQRQQQQAGEVTPPAAAAAAVGDDSAGQYLLTPVDIDLENGQGEEEEEPQGEQDVMQQTTAQKCHNAVLAAAAGHLDDTDGGLGAMQIDPVQAADAVGSADPVTAQGTTAVAATAAGDRTVTVCPAVAGVAAPTWQTLLPDTDSAPGYGRAGLFNAEYQSMGQPHMSLKCNPPLTTGVRPHTSRMTRQDSSNMSPSHLGLNIRLEAAAAGPSSQLAAAGQGVEAVAIEGATGDVGRQKQGQQQDGQQQQQQAKGCDQPDQVFGCSKCRNAKLGCIGCNPAKAQGSKRKKRQ